MKLVGRFFIIALLVSIISGVVDNIQELTAYFTDFNFESLRIIGIVFTPLRLAFGVFFPFLLMYFQAKELDIKDNLNFILFSAFLGSWIGGLASFFGIRISLYYIAGWNFLPSNVVQAIFTVIMQIVSLAFYPIIFILATAILFAYYQKYKEQTRF